MIEASAGKHSVTTGSTACLTASANVAHCPRRTASTSSRWVIGSGGVAVIRAQDGLVLIDNLGY
jgi:hypothetical protein